MKKGLPKSARWFPLFYFLLVVTVGIILILEWVTRRKIEVWTFALQYWPLLLVIAGIDGVYRGRGAAFQTFLIIFGLALQLSNLDKITWENWELLFGLWPVIIVAIGLDLVFAGKNLRGQIAAAGMILLVIVGIVWIFDMQDNTQGRNITRISQDRGSARQAVVSLQRTIGFLKIYAQGSSNLLVDGNLRLWDGEMVYPVYEINADEGRYQLSGSGLALVYKPGIENRAKWDVGINSRLPVELNIGQMVGEVSIDLSELIVESLRVNLSAGTLRINLNRGARFSGQIHQQIGNIFISIPAGTEIQVVGRPLIGSVQVPETYERNGNLIRSPGYDASENKVHLDINLRIGQLIIRER